MIKADLHAHSTLQPYGQTFREKPTRKSKRKTSIWYYNPPKGIKKWLEKILGISAYSQANFTSAGKGNVGIIGVSLYPPEISFFKNRLPRIFGNGLENIVTRYSQDRIHEIESGTYDYFEDLQQQYKFMLDANHSSSANGKYTCELVKNSADLKKGMRVDHSMDVVLAFINIEGAHALGCGYPDFVEHDLTERQKNRILSNILTIKKWEYPVVYITLCHHFYNQLCGHCKSLPDSIAKLTDQSYGMDFPISSFGYTVIEKLLSTENGPRILIDIKHMSIASRQLYLEYVEDLREKSSTYIPIVYSHGGPNGRKTYGTHPEDSQDKKLNPEDLGLFDLEIEAIAASDGIIGLNMDQRVMASKSHLKHVISRAFLLSKRKRKYLWAGIIWNNIKYIAEKLNAAGYAPWDYMALGTDFDGAINPVNYFVQERDLRGFSYYLKMHIDNYLQGTECHLFLKHQISSEEILEKLMYKNAVRFLKENLN